MHVLLCEPYFTGSHRAWAEGYARHSRHRVTLLTHAGRFWKWRMQGAALTLAQAARSLVARDGPPDLLLATDMLHLPAFLGFTRRFLGDPPVALYMHENQLTYPPPPGTKPDLTYAMINWLSMAAADRIFFNSAYHRAVFFEALPRLLKHFPDYTHTPLIEAVVARCEVLPVGVDLRRLDGPCPDRADGPTVILWNQRWEYDKDPATFFAALYRLADEGLPFRLILAGENFRRSPQEFEEARRRMADRLLHFGYAEPEVYPCLLRQADVVVSTARQEFFGVAVVEAIYAGAFPVLPRRLTYPDLIPPAYHDRCLYDDLEGLVTRLRWAVTHRERARAIARALRPIVASFDWAELAPRYDERLAALRQADEDRPPPAAHPPAG